MQVCKLLYHICSNVSTYCSIFFSETVKISWTWKRWADKIKQNFERYFFIPLDANEQLDGEVHDAKMVNVRGIYKDSFKASQPWADYQCRPNFAITLALVNLHVLFCMAIM